MVPRWLTTRMSLVADEIGSDEPVDLQGGDVARPAGQIDNGIGPLLR